MNKMHKLAVFAVFAGTCVLSIQQASAWWGGNDRWNDDYWYDRPGYYRHGGPYGWGGGGPYGWGGGPYGWGGGPYGWGGGPYGWGNPWGATTGGRKEKSTPPPRPE